MTKKTGIKKTPGAGVDRVEWMDAERRVHVAKASDPTALEHVTPGAPTRLPMKWDKQRASQGHYWCSGTQTMVWHESMSEFTAMMLLDHLFDIIDVCAQPMLLTFANGRHHTPDYFITTAQGERILVDVHDADLTTEADALKFELTRLLCERVGWRYELFDTFTDATRWSLEMMARYQHPRYAPNAATEARILKLVSKHETFGALREALVTDKPGEHLPAVFHLMWQRAIRFELDKSFSDRTRLYAA
ncbi:hypothetical protein BOH66_06455 [Microbacterium aurum]|uniref:TnsA-like heteromeric transposase endonuclease subunit n=1 Tax=Microbacterium aurum TaxID=36805 RepID=A0A1P8U764_9MICO|nr:TnsA-like heteromeric transposase endonuclease subunit [Microbacterium aurum]APZ33939.1 hypothetical protein BOH66_06455 [Microbacterium aurum]MBM7827705.1 hypothetical protein [Microbacterium aurum]